MNWYYSKNNRQEGPVSAESIRSKISMGELTGSDLAWSEGMADWLPLSKISEFEQAFAPRAAVPMDLPPTAAPVDVPAYSAPAPGYTPQQPVPMMIVKPANGLAMTAMILGILAIVFTYNCACLNFVIALPAIIIGHIAHSRAKKFPDAGKVKTRAISGWVMGYLALVLGFVVVVYQMKKAMTMTPEEMRAQGMPEQQIQQMQEARSQWQQLMEGKVPQRPAPAEKP